MSETLFKSALANSMNYVEYRKMLDELMLENKTTGTNQTPEILEYSKMNIHRMNRIDKTVTLTEEMLKQLQKIPTKQLWLVLTEGWCGDAAQIIPYLAKMAYSSPNIDLHLVLRDENLELMDKYLTNGGRSIPKLICLDAKNLTEKWTWGPRPVEAQQIFIEHKATPNADFKEFAEKLHGWYAKDKGKAVQRELLELIKK